ncbi:DEAD-box ATP-dependent RNA helicase 50 [Iris pallida]|uniref:DEAD-box ATP-dependent RNA helicase 50 n=1 Tax=Iris pallida TaxID=29817 RepID=A0AAX6FW05_IRIPA|nr:DEAD-box ATP-dependent RNA helicase 50 [Iris pallida]
MMPIPSPRPQPSSIPSASVAPSPTLHPEVPLLVLPLPSQPLHQHSQVRERSDFIDLHLTELLRIGVFPVLVQQERR